MEKVVKFIREHADLSAAAALFIVTMLFFLPGLDFDTIALDTASYTGKEYLLYPTWQNFIYHLKTPVLGLYSPLVMHSFMLDYWVWGRELLQTGGRLHNIILHSLNAVLFYLLLRKIRLVRLDPAKPLNLSIPAAILATLCFALHAQRVESVIWVVERKDVQVLFLGLASTLLFIGSYRKNRLPVAGALLFLLSFGAKPLMITLPGVLALGIWAGTEKLDCKKALKALSPYLAVMLVYMITNFVQLSNIASGSAAGAVSADRLSIVAVNYANYFFRTLLPLDIRPLYPLFKWNWVNWSLTVSFWGMCLAFIAAAAIRWRGRKLFTSTLLPLLLAFLGSTLPMAGFKVIGNAEFADRYSYYPSIFIWIGIALAYEYFAPRRTVWQFIFWAYAALQAILGFCYLQTWQSEESFISVALGKDGTDAHPAVLRMAAWECLENEEYEAALKFAEQALAQSDDFRRKEDELYFNALQGLVLMLHGNADGLSQIDRALSTPQWGRVCVTASGFAEKIMFFAAEMHLRRNTQYDLRFAAGIFQALGDFYRGRDTLKELNCRAIAAKLTGDYRTAETLTLKALELSPGDANLLHNLNSIREDIRNLPAKEALN